MEIDNMLSDELRDAVRIATPLANIRGKLKKKVKCCHVGFEPEAATQETRTLVWQRHYTTSV